MKSIRAVVVDDSDRFRAQLVAFLRDLEICVVAEANTGVEGLDAVERHLPDLVLVDLDMPVMHGLELTTRLARRAKPPLIVVVSIYDDGAMRAAAVNAGAQCVVGKDELVEVLPPLLEQLFSSEVAQDTLAG